MSLTIATIKGKTFTFFLTNVECTKFKHLIIKKQLVITFGSNDDRKKDRMKDR